MPGPGGSRTLMVEWANEPWLIGMVRILVGYRGIRRVSRGSGMGFKAAWEVASEVGRGGRGCRRVGEGRWVQFGWDEVEIGENRPISPCTGWCTGWLDLDSSTCLSLLFLYVQGRINRIILLHYYTTF